MLFVVNELAIVYGAVSIKILSFALLFVLKPVANVEFSFHVVVLALSVLHTAEKVTLVSLTILVAHLASSLRSPLKHLALELGPVGHLHADDMVRWSTFWRPLTLL